MRSSPRAACFFLSMLLCGCGATTFRVAVAPTLDTTGRFGVEATFGIGIGWPLDFHNRSQHFLQARPWLGGGRDAGTASGAFVFGVDADYIYHATSSPLDFRAGLHFADRVVTIDNESKQRFAAGLQVGILPIVAGSEANWLLWHFCVGPELRAELQWLDIGNRGLFSLPLVAELNLLAAGD